MTQLAHPDTDTTALVGRIITIAGVDHRILRAWHGRPAPGPWGIAMETERLSDCSRVAYGVYYGKPLPAREQT